MLAIRFSDKYKAFLTPLKFLACATTEVDGVFML